MSDHKPVNVIVPCRRVIDARTGIDITDEPYVNRVFAELDDKRPVCMCRLICRGCAPDVKCRGLVMP